MQNLLNQVKTSKTAQMLLFSEALKKIVAENPARAQEIVFARYGVFNSKAMTLEEIGKKYHITRERVRQVIREVLKKTAEKKSDPIFSEVREQIVLALENNGGIMEEKQLLKVLGGDNTSERAAAAFFLECMDDVLEKEIKGELAFSYALPSFDFERWQTLKNNAIAVLKNQKKPLTAKELHSLLVSEIEELELIEEMLVHHLNVSEEIKKNTFGKWGVAHWKEISPKGTREKAYMVLKETDEPLHFRDIAKKIDQYKLSKKKTHAQTVHNELIKDENFVLIGRGIYALTEWGYRSGTVKDVIEDILQKSEKPLSKDEIVKKVLEIRHVKKSTIVINLNNFFEKSKSGLYSIKR